MIADASGRAAAFRVAPGQAHEAPQAVPLLGRLPGVPGWVVADRSLSSHAFRERVWGSRHASNRRAARHPAEGDRGASRSPARRGSTPTATASSGPRHRLGRARLKEWRAVAARYEKTAASFLGVLCLAATIDWLRR